LNIDNSFLEFDASEKENIIQKTTSKLNESCLSNYHYKNRISKPLKENNNNHVDRLLELDYQRKK
jgi:hypothetical protein